MLSSEHSGSTGFSSLACSALLFPSVALLIPAKLLETGSSESKKSTVRHRLSPCPPWRGRVWSGFPSTLASLANPSHLTMGQLFFPPLHRPHAPYRLSFGVFRGQPNIIQIIWRWNLVLCGHLCISMITQMK